MIYEDRPGGLWLGTRRGLINTDRARRGSEYFEPDSIHQGSKDGYTIDVEESKDGLWLTFGGKLLNFNAGTKSFIRYGNQSAAGRLLSNAYVGTILKDREGFLWIGGSNGLFRLN